MTMNQRAAQKTRRFNEWQARGNRAAGVNRVEDILIEAQHAAIEAAPFAVTAEGPNQFWRSCGTGQFCAARVVYYSGGDGAHMQTFIGRGDGMDWALEQLERQIEAWKAVQS